MFSKSCICSGFSTREFKFDVTVQEASSVKEISDSRFLVFFGQSRTEVFFFKMVMKLAICAIIFTKYLVYCLVYVAVQSTEIY